MMSTPQYRTFTVEDGWIGLAMFCFGLSLVTYGISTIIGILILRMVHMRHIPRLPSILRSIGMFFLLWINMFVGLIFGSAFADGITREWSIWAAAYWVIFGCILLGIFVFLYYAQKRAKIGINQPPIHGKFCAFCGVVIAHDALFCPRCGKKVADVQTQK